MLNENSCEGQKGKRNQEGSNEQGMRRKKRRRRRGLHYHWPAFYHTASDKLSGRLCKQAHACNELVAPSQRTQQCFWCFEENKLRDKDFNVSPTKRLWTLAKMRVKISHNHWKEYCTSQKKNKAQPLQKNGHGTSVCGPVWKICGLFLHVEEDFRWIK